MTNAELAILSLLAEQPRHGYEIDRVIDERGMREWTEIGFSSIYYLLRKLEAKGAVEAAVEQEGRGPARRVYRATEAGRGAMRQGLIEALSRPNPSPLGLQLGLASLPLLPPSEARTALSQRAEALAARQHVLAAKQRDQAPLPLHVAAMFSHSEALITAELAWLYSLLAEWDALTASQNERTQ